MCTHHANKRSHSIIPNCNEVNCSWIGEVELEKFNWAKRVGISPPSTQPHSSNPSCDSSSKMGRTWNMNPWTFIAMWSLMMSMTSPEGTWSETATKAWSLVSIHFLPWINNVHSSDSRTSIWQGLCRAMLPSSVTRKLSKTQVISVWIWCAAISNKG